MQLHRLQCNPALTIPTVRSAKRRSVAASHNGIRSDPEVHQDLPGSPAGLMSLLVMDVIYEDVMAG